MIIHHILVMRHPPEKVRQALSDPAHVGEWAPFAPMGAGRVGTLKLTTVGAPAARALLDRLKDHLNGRGDGHV